MKKLSKICSFGHSISIGFYFVARSIQADDWPNGAALNEVASRRERAD